MKKLFTNHSKEYKIIVTNSLQFTEVDMKKIKAILSVTATFIATAGSCIPVSGLEYCETLTYIVSENEAIITGFFGNPEVLNLPSEIDGKKVTQIRENAFYKCEALTEITVPESVTSIGHHAFFGCTSLENVRIGGDIEKLSEGIFYGCESLRSVEVRNISAIDNYAFFGCESLERFSVPQSVTSIGEYSFFGCLSLSDVSLGNKLRKIDRYAFHNCPQLTKITLPESLDTIGQYAVGFTDNGISDGFTIVGMQGSIAEHYADNSNLNFKHRITSQRNSTINVKLIIDILIWLVFAFLYCVVMFRIIPSIKKQKRRRAYR